MGDARMTEGAGAEQVLLDLIEEGVGASADSLAEVSRTKWTTQTTSSSADASGSLEKIRTRLAGDQTEQYGAFMSMPGAVFLLMLPQKSGAKLAEAFLGEKRLLPGASVPPEGACVAEIANIVVNAIANTMANACDDSFVLSAPTMILGKKERFLTLAQDELKAAGETFAIMTYVSMSSQSLSSDCTVLLLLSPACRGRILKALDQ
ncbi:MAG TPA: hypothetical protein VH309_07595 [Elusimicrobiota bacterium]|nr:hypothetical protein [Elusimicrobiota bacterium]